MHQQFSTSIVGVTNGVAEARNDDLAIEEPLEIRVAFSDRKMQPLAITMRTPGHDTELALGFLFSEAIIKDLHPVKSITLPEENVVEIVLNATATVAKKADRQFYVSSSCGVCGKASRDAVRMHCDILNDDFKVPRKILEELPKLLASNQDTFNATGGLHASALFSAAGELLIIREDVGRHNALDKVIGAALDNYTLPLHGKILLVSGRSSFELVQKAALAGIAVMASVSAPSSLAVSLAKEVNMTLVGFLRGDRFNIYSAPQRISI